MLKQPRIVVDKHQERLFRRRAYRAYPAEHIETLWGFVHAGTVYVCAFTPIDYTAAPTWIQYDDEEWDLSEELAREHGLAHIGSCHTHPDRAETIFSEQDLRSSLEEGRDLVMAICAIDSSGKRRRSRMAYWPNVRPFALEYSDWSTK